LLNILKDEIKTGNEEEKKKLPEEGNHYE